MPEFEPEISAFTNYLLAIPNEEITATLRKKEGTDPHVWDSMIESDSVAAWINQCIKRDPGYISAIGPRPAEIDAIKSGAFAPESASQLTLYSHYVWYCRANGFKERTSTTFSNAVLDLCHQTLGWCEIQKSKNKANSRILVGISLKSPEDTSIDDLLLQASKLEANLGE